MYNYSEYLLENPPRYTMHVLALNTGFSLNAAVFNPRTTKLFTVTN